MNDVAVLEVEDKALEVGGEVRDPEVAEGGEGGVVRGEAGGRAEERDGGVVPEDLEAGELGEQEVVVLGTLFQTRCEYGYGRSWTRNRRMGRGMDGVGTGSYSLAHRCRSTMHWPVLRRKSATGGGDSRGSAQE